MTMLEMGWRGRMLALGAAMGFVVASDACGGGGDNDLFAPVSSSGGAAGSVGPAGCNDSSECSQGVCDTAQHRCVECARVDDCSTGQRCESNRCVGPCTSDKQCTAAGLLC